jgi:hypothetical protein
VASHAMDCTHLVVSEVVESVGRPFLLAMVRGIPIVSTSWIRAWIGRRSPSDAVPLEGSHLPECRANTPNRTSMLPVEARRRLFVGLHVMLPTQKLHDRLGLIITMAGAAAIHSCEEVTDDMIRDWIAKGNFVCLLPEGKAATSEVMSFISSLKTWGAPLMSAAQLVTAIVSGSFSLLDHTSVSRNEPPPRKHEAKFTERPSPTRVNFKAFKRKAHVIETGTRVTLTPPTNADQVK